MVKAVYFTFLMFAFTSIGLAQTKLNQGKVIFEITYKNIPTIMMSQQHMLPRDAVFYFKDSLTRIEMGIANQGKNITINNHKTGNIYILLNLYNQKFALVKHDSDLIALKKEFNKDTATITDFKVEIKTGETKTISGYLCTKAIISKKISGVTRENICWYTNQMPNYNLLNSDEFKKIDGFLMEYSSMENGITTTFKAKNVVPVPVDDSLFAIPESFKVVTEEELTRLYNYFKMMQNDTEN